MILHETSPESKLSQDVPLCYAADVKVALAQINTTVGDLAGNAKLAADAYRRGVEAGAQVVLLPEMTLTGYPPRDLLTKRRFVDENLGALENLAQQTGDTALLVGYVERNETRVGKQLLNAAALLAGGKIVSKVFKTLLPTYDVFDEDRYFQPAEKNAPVVFGDGTLGISICEDIWNDEDYWPQRLYRRDPIAELHAAGAQILFNISASPYELGKEGRRYDMLRAVAVKHGLPLLYCNLVGGNDELIFDGNSMAFDGQGHLIAQGAPFHEDFVLVDLGNPKPIAFTPPSEDVELHDALVLGLRDYARKCGFKTAVLGLSGGIDSALVAYLAVAALGRENVRGLAMPSQFSSDHSISDARLVAQNLGIRFDVLPIQDTFEALKKSMRGVFEGRPEDTAEENMQARIRGQMLMAISNKFGHLLLTTGNKSELAVGYCTLYGDMAGGFAPISDVPKMMVYKLSRWINEQARAKQQTPPIPEGSLTKPPSAELRANQTDQDTLPPYEILDPIMRAYVEQGKSRREIIATGFDEKTVDFVLRRIDLNEYKRKQAPPGLKVTPKAFGLGRRMPIAQRYVER